MCCMNVYITLDTTSQTGGGQVIFNRISSEKEEKSVLFCPSGELAQACEKFAQVFTFPAHTTLIAKVKFTRRQLQQIVVPSQTTVFIHGISALPLGVIATLGTPTKREYTEHLLTKDFTLQNRNKYRMQLIAYRLFLLFVHKVTAVSKAVRNFLVDNLDISSSKVSVEYSSISPLPKHVQYSYKKQVSLLSVGSLVHIKNFLQLIDVVSEVLNRVDVVLTIVGNGEQRRVLQNHAQELGISDKIVFTGAIPHAEVINLMEKADIYVQSSLSESFGFAIAEAQSIGLPVIAFNVGGIPEVVEHNKTGLLITPYSSSEFADAIVTLAEDVELRRRFGNLGRESMKRFY